jgi:flagellar biosynthetic protein FlhB
MAESDGQEKTEDATPKRLREAREKGQLPRSRELNTMAMMVAAATAFLVIGDSIMQELMALLKEGFTLERQSVFDKSAMIGQFSDLIFEALFVLAPFLILMVIVAFLASVLVSGWNFSPSAIAFKWEKLDPIKGLGRVFAVRGLIELLKALIKFVLIGSVAVIYLWNSADDFLSLGLKDIDTALADTGSLIAWAFLIISISLILLALIDVPFQLWDNAKQLRMTKQEVRDEFKQTEGNPEVKGRIRQMQREMAQRRMMEQVPQADVIITNPTHFAVAIKYDQENMAAPILVAKGMDEIAANIRAVAATAEVPMLSAPVLARALYYSTELDQEIPVGLFQAVAQVLAYIYHLNQGEKVDEATVINNLSIPEELQHD